MPPVANKPYPTGLLFVVPSLAPLLKVPTRVVYAKETWEADDTII